MKLKLSYLVYMALFFFACYALFRPKSWTSPASLPDLDKFAHFALFLSMSCTSFWVFRSDIRRWYYHMPLLVLAIFSEIYQGSFLPDRQFGLGDLTANLLGIFSGYFFYLWLRVTRWRHSW